MDERDLNSTDTSMTFEPPDADDIEAVAAFYERNGVIPVSSIGLPIDRPIIPSRRLDRVGDFKFTPGGNAAAPSDPGPSETEDPETEKLHHELLDMLNDKLKDL